MTLLPCTLLPTLILYLATTSHAYYHNNLVYLSPVYSIPEYGIHTTHSQHGFGKLPIMDHVKRELRIAMKYHDSHYSYYSGGDYSKSIFIQAGGINFTHHVASGDPWDTSVILWTRAMPAKKDEYSDNMPICVKYEVAELEDTSFNNVVSSGDAFTDLNVDWTVKVEAKGLKPDTRYVYRFSDCTNPATKSPVGKTRTMASPDTPADQVNGGKPLNLAVFSCANYPHVNNLTDDKTVDVFVHLGDYTYEYGGGGKGIGRFVPGGEEATLTDYRNMLALYRTDEGLINAHLAGPWITVWDDHEVSDNSWKGGSHDSNNTRPAGCNFSPSHACFKDRKEAAIRAYHEWLPIRQVDGDDKWRIWRDFRIGKLIDLMMLDTRHYDRDITDIYTNRDYIAKIANQNNRTMMGQKQEKWFLDRLSDSKQRGTVWRIIGQQVVFSQIDYGGKYNGDAWDGYRANRARILNHIKSQQIGNAVILSGDSHANWVSDLTFPNDTSYDYTTGKGSLGVELAVTAVSSSGCCKNTTDADKRAKQRVKANDELQWNENFYRGFYTIAVDKDNMKATFYAMKDVTKPNLDGNVIAEFDIRAGENKISRPVAGGHVQAGFLKTVSKAVHDAKEDMKPTKTTSSKSSSKTTSTTSTKKSSSTKTSATPSPTKT